MEVGICKGQPELRTASRSSEQQFGHGPRFTPRVFRKAKQRNTNLKAQSNSGDSVDDCLYCRYHECC